MIDRFEHRREVRIVIGRPVMARIALPQSRVFAQVALLPAGFPGRVFVSVFFDEVGPSTQNRVWRVVAEIEKEGFVLMALDELHRFQVQPVGQVLVFTKPVSSRSSQRIGCVRKM